MAELDEPLKLAVIERRLGTPLHGVVVRGDGDGQAVDRADTLHETVGRAFDLGVGGHGEHAVFDERVVVEQHGDPLAGGELAARVDFGDGVGPGVVHCGRPRVEHFLDQVVVHLLRSPPLRRNCA